MRKFVLALSILALVAADASACHRGGRRAARRESRHAAHFGGGCGETQAVAVSAVSACGPAAAVTATATVVPQQRLMPKPEAVPTPIPAGPVP